MEKERRFFDAMESDIMNADIPETERNKLMKNFLQLKEQKINHRRNWLWKEFYDQCTL